MKFNIYPHTIASKPGMPYAELKDLKGESFRVGVLSHILDFVGEKDHEIVNANEALLWIHKNCRIVSVQ